jgi:O-antigen/teichoic acid export membrane protein
MLTLRDRLIRGIGATAVTPFATAAIQLGAVPLLLHAWGAAKYGDWILLTAVPSYLSMSDLGFGDASGSDMTARVAAGDKEGALRTFQSSWVLLTLICAIVAIAALLLTPWFPWQSWLRLAGLSGSEAAAIITVMTFYVLVGQQAGVLESGYRCDGNYALGTALASALRLAEAAGATAIGVASKSLLYTAIAYLSIKAIGVVFYAIVLRRKSPWLRLGISHASMDAVKQLALPAASFVVLPLAQALSFQGFTVLIGILLGPLAVATFSTLRTLTRVNTQVVASVGHTLWPEFSRAFGSGDISLARTLHQRAYQVALAVSALSSITLWVAGPAIYHLWVRNALTFDSNCFHVLILVSVANTLWSTSSVVAMSTNRHHWLALSSLAGAAGSLGLCYFLIDRLGLTGAALSLLVSDVAMIVIVLRDSLYHLRETIPSFSRALITFRTFPASQHPKEA